MAEMEMKQLKLSDSKFIEIKNKLQRYDINVNKILKINNHHLKIAFESELCNLKQRKTSNFHSNITSLYHGTQANWELLAHEGLDERLSRKGRFGRGIYFSDNPQKCCNYTLKEKDPDSKDQFILVCNVILGDIKEFEKGAEARDLKKEPVKEIVDGRIIYFDSVKGQPKDCMEYVVYDKRRVLIKYIVFYSSACMLNDKLTNIMEDDITSEQNMDSDNGSSSDGSSDNTDSDNEDSLMAEGSMAEQKNLALLKLMDIRAKVTPQDLEELIIAFIQTYGSDETLNKFFPEIISAIQPIQLNVKTIVTPSQDAIFEVMKQEVEEFQAFTGCHDSNQAIQFLKQAGMNLNLAISTYFDQL